MSHSPVVKFFTLVFIKLKNSTHCIGTLSEALKKNLHGNPLRLLAEFSSLGDRILAGLSLSAGAKEEHYSQHREVSCRSCHVTCS